MSQLTISHQPGLPPRRQVLCRLLTICAALLATLVALPGSAAERVKIVATIPTYGAIAQYIAGSHGEVESIAKGYEDPHFVRPKPSLSVLLSNADLLISTGLDLELWLPALLDKANNPKIRSGQPGFVSAADGIQLLDKPTVLSRNEGGLHIYGNPHIYTGPLNGKIIARNIMVGLKKVDPGHADAYEKNYARFVAELDQRLFGAELVKILGSTLLTKLALSDKLIPYLEGNSFQGKPLTSYLGGWLKQAMPLRGRKLVAYHKNWAYFEQTFGMSFIAYVEPKPGIPPSPGHVADVIQKMKDHRVPVLLAASYYDQAKVKAIADKTGAKAVIVGLSVGGEPGMNSFFDQFDLWIRKLVASI